MQLFAGKTTFSKLSVIYYIDRLDGVRDYFYIHLSI